MSDAVERLRKELADAVTAPLLYMEQNIDLERWAENYGPLLLAVLETALAYRDDFVKRGRNDNGLAEVRGELFAALRLVESRGAPVGHQEGEKQ